MAKNFLKKVIFTLDAPKPVGPYSQAIVAGNQLFIAGQIGLDISGVMVPGGIVPETEQVFKNLEAILKAADASFDNVVKATVLLVDMNDFPTVNDIYKKYFLDSPPARAAYAVKELPKGAKIEIEAVAILN